MLNLAQIEKLVCIVSCCSNAVDITHLSADFLYTSQLKCLILMAQHNQYGEFLESLCKLSGVQVRSADALYCEILEAPVLRVLVSN